MSFSPKSIVVPFDLSEPSLQAVTTALEIAGETSEVHVVHVLQEMQVADPGVVWQEIDNDNRAQHAKQAVYHRLAPEISSRVKVHIELGDPGHRVADFAAQQKADLIVTASHGRTGISRMLIGSVAERVVRLAHCPVLVLRNAASPDDSQ